MSPGLQNLTEVTSYIVQWYAKDRKWISNFKFEFYPTTSERFETRDFHESHGQIQWIYIGFGASWREQKTDFLFTYFQLEFEAHTLWIRSTHEYYNFTGGELQTPARNDSMIISLFWWECVFVKTLHLNQHHHSRRGFEQGGNAQYRSVVLQDQVRYSRTVFCVALHNVWRHSS